MDVIFTSAIEGAFFRRALFKEGEVISEFCGMSTLKAKTRTFCGNRKADKQEAVKQKFNTSKPNSEKGRKDTVQKSNNKLMNRASYQWYVVS